MNEMIPVAQNQSFDYVDPAAIAAAETAKARVQAAYLMALRKPRNFDQSRANILEACKRPLFAERVEYSKPVGGKAIRGPSVRFAELAIREWGNVLSETQVVYEDANIRRIKVTLTDLETNSTHSKEIQIGKTVERKSAGDREIIGERKNSQNQTVYIVKATDDELHNKEAALISKAVRNEGLRLIPSDIIDEALETAKNTLSNRDKADPAAAKKRVMDAFSELGIKPKDLEQYLKHKIDITTPAELQDLRGVYQALKSGEATWADYIQPNAAEEGTESKKEALKEKMKAKKAMEPIFTEPSTTPEQPRIPCPNLAEDEWATPDICADCRQREGCPSHDREPGSEG